MKTLAVISRPDCYIGRIHSGKGNFWLGQGSQTQSGMPSTQTQTPIAEMIAGSRVTYTTMLGVASFVPLLSVRSRQWCL